MIEYVLVQMRKMYFLWLFHEVFCRCVLDPVGQGSFKSRVSLLVFCLDDLSNAFSEMLMSPSIIVRSSKSFLR